MARIRSLKPMFFQHDGLSALDAETHILAAGLLCYADDFGYFNANPKLIEAFVFPLRSISRTIPEMIGSLCKIGYIVLGNCKDGRTYGRVVNFEKHQRVYHPTPSVISILDIKWDDSREIPEPFPKSSGGNKEGNKEVEVEGKDQKPPIQPKSETPTDLHELQYAARIVEDLELVSTPRLIEIIGSAVMTAAKRNKSDKSQGFEWLRRKALDAKGSGTSINRFWFEDADKWDTKNGVDDGISERVAQKYKF